MLVLEESRWELARPEGRFSVYTANAGNESSWVHGGGWKEKDGKKGMDRKR